MSVHVVVAAAIYAAGFVDTEQRRPWRGCICIETLFNFLLLTQPCSHSGSVKRIFWFTAATSPGECEYDPFLRHVSIHLRC